METSENEGFMSKQKKVYCMCKPISDIRYKSAQELLALGNQVDKVPVDLKKLLMKLKISCLSHDFSALDAARKAVIGPSYENSILGALVTNGDRAVIFYREGDQIDGHRYRFTIAHELAHACLAHYPIGESSVHLSFRTDKADSQEEIDANIFAGELLIPEDALKRVINELIFPSVQTLSNIFAVSQNVMLARLEHLKICNNISGYNC